MVVVVPPLPAGPSRAPTPPPRALVGAFALRGAPPPRPRPRPRTLPPLLATIHRRPLRPLPPGLARAGPGRRRGRTAPPGPVRRVVVSSARASGPGAPRRAAPRPPRPPSSPRGPMGFGTRPSARECPGHPTLSPPLSGPMRGRSGVHGCGAGAVDPPAGAGAPRGPAPGPSDAAKGASGLRWTLDRGKRRFAARSRPAVVVSCAGEATGGSRTKMRGFGASPEVGRSREKARMNRRGKGEAVDGKA